MQHIKLLRNLIVATFKMQRSNSLRNISVLTFKIQQSNLLRNLYKYYCFCCLSPIWKIDLVWKVRYPFLVMYTFLRCLSAINVVYELQLFWGMFYGIHGDLGVFDKLEAVLLLMAESMYIPIDVFILNKEFLHNFDQLLVLYDRVFDQTSQNKIDQKEQFKLRKKCWRFIVFSAILDYYQVFGAFKSLRDSFTHHSQFFSILPRITPFLETILWYIQSYNISVLLLATSFATTFSGCLAFYIEACVNTLARRVAVLDQSKPISQLWTLIEQFRQLQYVTREINKHLGLGLLLFYFILAVQQIAQTYCIFRLIREGVDLSDLFFLFTDIFICASRVIYSSHALSTVDSSSTNFLNKFKRSISLRKGDNALAPRKILRSTYRSLQGVHMKVGNPCSRDFALTLMNIFSSCYFTAALWT